MKHTISVWVENRFGVLARLAGLFAARGYNIDSLAVAETEDPTISKATIVVRGDENTLEQIKKQLNKLIDVIKVVDLTKKDHVERELVLIRVDTSQPQKRAQIMEIIDIFRGKIVDVAKDSIVIEITGDEKKISGFISLLGEYKILEITRTGKIAIERGRK